MAFEGERRLRLMSVAVDLLETLLREGTATVKPVNVPADARILALSDYWHKGHHLVDVVVWSSTFDVVPEGVEPPAFLPRFRDTTSLTVTA